jgi:crotonobetainyl-CoA:carnitine CoA-transferase CaiB-like acyl-CoA transferase
MMAGLLEQRVTGRGRHIDVSQVEAMLPLTAFWILHQQLHGKPHKREGLRHPVHAPHGCFRCVGDDSWVAIGVTTDDQWQGLCAVLEDPALQNAELAHAASRKEHEDRIEAALSDWCAKRTAEEVTALLQAKGVPAGEAVAPGDTPANVHLQARGVWQRVTRPFVEPQIQASAPFREHQVAYAVRSGSPTLGQHTEKVLSAKLGLGEDELESLRRAGVIGTAATGAKVRSRLHKPASEPAAPGKGA